jgi:hypothetical protein
MKALLNPWIARLLVLLRGLGPYAAIELLLPGGSVIALLIWLYRHRANPGQRRHELPTVPHRAPASHAQRKVTCYLSASNFVVRLMQELNDADQFARTCGPALLVVCTEQLDWFSIC